MMSGGCTSAADLYPFNAPPVSPNPTPLKKRKLDHDMDEFALLNPSYASQIHPLLCTQTQVTSMQVTNEQEGGHILSMPPSSHCPLFTLLSEDLLVCICEHFNIRELALLDRVCRVFRSMLNLPTDTNLDAATLHGHAANYIWRNAALSSKAWPFPRYIDREHLERVVLKHLRKLPSRTPSPSPTATTALSLLTPSSSTGTHPTTPPALTTSTSMVQTPLLTATSHSTMLPSINPYDSPKPSTLLAPTARPSTVLPPLNWKQILANVESRTEKRGTGTLVLDMGSCTVSVGLGGPDAGEHGNPDAFKSFPAIALNDLVGDQIGSASVRSINPVSSISMPILHANETGEFSYCSPIWKYALQRVPEHQYSGRGNNTPSTSTTLVDPPALSLDSSDTPMTNVEHQTVTSPTTPAAASSTAISSASLAISTDLPTPTSSTPPPITPGASLALASQALSLAQHAGSAVETEGGAILICDQLLGSKIELAKKRAKVARILFALQPPGCNKVKLAFCNESFLSLLNTGKTTGVVLHVGFSRSTCAIFVNGRIQNLSSLPTRMVGGHIHSRIMLQALFSRRQFQPAVADMFAVIPMLKAECYVAEDTAEEQQKPREVTHVEITITDKKLTLGHERFTSSDVFFLYGFPAMVVEALQSSPAWPVLQRPSMPLQPSPLELRTGGHQHMAQLSASAIDMGGSRGRSMLNQNQATGQDAAAAGGLSSSSSTTDAASPLPVSPRVRRDSDVQMADVSDLTSSSSSNPSLGTSRSVANLQQTFEHLKQRTRADEAKAGAVAMEEATSLDPVAFPSNAVRQRATDEEQQHNNSIASTVAPLTSSSSTSTNMGSISVATVSHTPTFSPGDSLSALQHHHAHVGQENEEDEPHQLIKTLLQSIVLSGRSTSLRGFAARFERDLNAILKQNTPAKVHENHVECSWLGGSVLSALSCFPSLCITRDEFAQDGINAILRHMEI